MEEKVMRSREKAASAAAAVAVCGGLKSCHLPNQSLICGRGSFSISSTTKPSWLLFTIADLNERIQMLALNTTEEENADSFAERAEVYYHKRPLLLSLIQDLYNGYLSLADRYGQSLAKCRRRQHSSPVPTLYVDSHFGEEGDNWNIESDVESSLSYQQPILAPLQPQLDADVIVAELVMKNVEYEIIQHELGVAELRCNESSRKIELQKSLLEVLESERLILLNENAKFGYRVNVLVKENKGLAADSLFMKRKASELARCVLKMREDHRVCMLSRKIEDLQEQIYGLEKRNKEYYDQLIKQEDDKGKGKTKRTKNKNEEVTLDDCYHDDEKKASIGMTLANVIGGRTRRSKEKRVSKFLNRVKNFDLFFCGPHLDSDTGC